LHVKYLCFIFNITATLPKVQAIDATADIDAFVVAHTSGVPCPWFQPVGAPALASAPALPATTAAVVNAASVRAVRFNKNARSVHTLAICILSSAHINFASKAYLRRAGKYADLKISQYYVGHF
jgi:hypothetical protein